jgi:uncharacterized membrane protein YbhN (UPF0104 family)
VEWPLLVLIGLLNIMNIFSNGVFMKVILKPFGKYISLKESVRVSLISSLGNFFAPAGSGFGFRAVYLNKKHGLAYSDYVSTLYGNYIIVFLISSLFGLLSLWMLYAKHDEAYFILLLVFGGMFVVSLLLSLIKIPSNLLNLDLKSSRVNKIAKIFLQMLKGWNGIVSNRNLMAKLAGLTIMNFFISVIISKLEISALHLTIGFPELILFSVLGSLSLFVSVTPANLGVKEAIYLFSSHVIGFTPAQILSIALIDRGMLFITLMILWIYTSKTKSADQLMA